MASSGELIIACWVPGVPRTKGSLNPHGMQDTPHSKAWRAQVARVARAEWWKAKGFPGSLPVDPPHIVSAPLSGRFEVRCVFHLPGEPDATRTGDIDKLVRNVLDAIGCTRNDDAHLIADDNMVTQLVAMKVRCDEQRGPGLDLMVSHA